MKAICLNNKVWEPQWPKGSTHIIHILLTIQGPDSLKSSVVVVLTVLSFAL